MFDTGCGTRVYEVSYGCGYTGPSCFTRVGITREPVIIARVQSNVIRLELLAHGCVKFHTGVTLVFHTGCAYTGANHHHTGAQTPHTGVPFSSHDTGPKR